MTSSSTSGLGRSAFQATAVVTTLSFWLSARNTTLFGASFFSDAGTSAIPWPQLTKAICEATERTSCSTRGEKPLARQVAIRLSK
ncbi:hypothetical protein D3C87_2035370 [compost metagenome]